MEPIHQLAIALLVGAAGGAIITERVIDYKMKSVREAYLLESNEWTKRASEDHRAMKMCMLLAKTFPTDEQSKILGQKLNDIVRAAEALRLIDTSLRATSPESVYVLTKYLDFLSPEQENTESDPK